MAFLLIKTLHYCNMRTQVIYWTRLGPCAGRHRVGLKRPRVLGNTSRFESGAPAVKISGMNGCPIRWPER